MIGFKRRTGTLWTPRVLPLRGWWSMQGPIQTNTGRVTLIDDVLGSGRQLALYGTSIGPALETVDGRPWARFSAAEDCGLDHASNFASSGQQVRTIAVVFWPDAQITPSSAEVLLGFANTDQALALGAYTDNWSDELVTIRYPGTAYASWRQVAGSLAAAPHILIAIFESAANGWSFHIDGSADLRNQAVGTHQTMQAGRCVIGRRHEGTTPEAFNGRFGELIASKASAALGERRQLERFLAGRWGVPLTG